MESVGPDREKTYVDPSGLPRDYACSTRDAKGGVILPEYHYLQLTRLTLQLRLTPF